MKTSTTYELETTLGSVRVRTCDGRITTITVVLIPSINGDMGAYLTEPLQDFIVAIENCLK